MRDELKCKGCGSDLECMGGRSAHRSNWYCPICDRPRQTRHRIERLEGVNAELLADNKRLHDSLNTDGCQVERLKDRVETLERLLQIAVARGRVGARLNRDELYDAEQALGEHHGP